MIDVGDPLPIQTMEVRDSSGALANAGAVTLTLTLPDDSTTSLGFTNTVTGRYVPGVYITQSPGRHTVHWVATGVNATTYTEAFDVRPPTRALVSLDDVRTYLNIDSSTTDEELRFWIEGATEEIEARCGAVIPRTVAETVYPLRGRLWLTQRPVLSITSATFWGSLTVISDWTLESAKLGLVTSTSGFYVGGPYVVTYRAGRTPTPAPLIGAALKRIQFSWQPQRAGTGGLRVGGFGPEAGEGGVGPQFTLLLDAQRLEAPYLLPMVG